MRGRYHSCNITKAKVQENNYFETQNGCLLGVDCGWQMIDELGRNWDDLFDGQFDRGWTMVGVVGWNGSTAGPKDWFMDPRVDETWVDGSLISRRVRSDDRWKELDGATKLLVNLEENGWTLVERYMSWSDARVLV